MSIDKHHNHDYSVGIPLAVGDRYYAQDMGRDFWHLLSSAGKVAKDLIKVSKFIVSGGNITYNGTAYKINMDAFVGYAPYSVTVPNSWASLPPSTQSKDVELVNVVASALTGFNITSDQPVPATCDGSTYNYIKIAYLETDLSSKARVHATGSYYREKVPSYVLTVNTVAPTDYEICLGQMKCTANGLTMTIINTYRDYDFVLDSRIQTFTASGTWRRPSWVTKVRVLCVGKGGNGGYGVNTSSNGGGGGGGGSGAIVEQILTVAGDVTITITTSLTQFGTGSGGQPILVANAGVVGANAAGAVGGVGGAGGCGGAGGGNGNAGGVGGRYARNGGASVDGISGGAGSYTAIGSMYEGGLGGIGAGSLGGGGGGGAGYSGNGGYGGGGSNAQNGQGYGAGGGGASSGTSFYNKFGVGGGGVCIVEILG